jgi:hypothetical protein
MKKLVAVLAALVALPIAFAQSSPTYTAQAGVTFFVQQSATAAATSGAVRLPTYSGSGVLNIAEAGITGSPSGCTVKLESSTNAGGAATAALSTTSFTPATGIQQFMISPSVPAGDNYTAVYACSSTYPTAGTISVTFSPINTNVQANLSGFGDPCQNPSVTKSSVAISIATATTTQVIALASGKAIYVCGLTDGSAGTTPSLTVEYGTGSACGTGTTVLTGVEPFTSGSSITMGYGGSTAMTVPSGNALCLVTVGTNHGGVLSYVQQ